LKISGERFDETSSLLVARKNWSILLPIGQGAMTAQPSGRNFTGISHGRPPSADHRKAV
jgi:hypothetical protein